MFNRFLEADNAAARADIAQAVELSRVPGQSQTRGNAAGTTSFISNALMPYAGEQVGGRAGQSGVDENGIEFYPFIVGVDGTDDESAYVMTGYPIIDYGN